MGKAAKKDQISKLMRDSSVTTTSGSDTIKLWESYRDQAVLWRAIALLQLPTTFILGVMSVSLWYFADVTLNVPRKPLPGIYQAQEIPETEFLDTAINFVNLLATYTPPVAEQQFREASKMLHEPALEKFRTEMMQGELRAVNQTQRTQIFFVDPTLLHLERKSSSEVLAYVIGDRQKMIAGRSLPMQRTLYEITMTTIPRNTLNPYGIVVTNVISRNVEKEFGKG